MCWLMRHRKLHAWCYIWYSQVYSFGVILSGSEGLQLVHSSKLQLCCVLVRDQARGPL